MFPRSTFDSGPSGRIVAYARAVGNLGTELLLRRLRLLLDRSLGPCASHDSLERPPGVTHNTPEIKFGRRFTACTSGGRPPAKNSAPNPTSDSDPPRRQRKRRGRGPRRPSVPLALARHPHAHHLATTVVVVVVVVVTQRPITTSPPKCRTDYLCRATFCPPKRSDGLGRRELGPRRSRRRWRGEADTHCKFFATCVFSGAPLHSGRMEFGGPDAERDGGIRGQITTHRNCT